MFYIRPGRPAQQGLRSAVLCAITVFAAAACLLFRFGPQSSAAYTEPVTVVLDAGHGGADGGATGAGGSVEKDINLDVVLCTADWLRYLGIRTVLTRSDDRSLHTSESLTLREQKSEDLINRVAIVNSCENALYIGVHSNKFGDTVSRGAQTFYTDALPQSRELAESVLASLKSVLADGNSRHAAVMPNKNYIMQNIQCPAVVVECGFLSHPEEERLLQTKAYREKLAFALAAGITRALAAE